MTRKTMVDYLGRTRKVYTDKWGYEHERRLYPMEWPWPIRDIMSFILYRDFIKLCTPEEIGAMRNEIGKYGFNHGIHIFEGWLRSKRVMEAYEIKIALRDIADGKEPGQSHREYVKQVEDGWAKDKERDRKRKLLREYQHELKNQQELDRLTEQELIDAIKKLKRKP
jgi:hypothetical protein